MHVSTLRSRIGSAGPLLVVPAAALLVHQLRYALAYGPHAGAELAAQGHSYLHSLVPWIVLSLGVWASSYVRRVARALRFGEAGRRVRSARALWAWTTAALLAVYAVQETLEGLFSPGHPGGLSAVVGHGGWWAVPASAALALAIVALLRHGDALVCRVARRAARPARAGAAAVRFPSPVDLVAPAPLALAAAGRAPPGR